MRACLEPITVKIIKDLHEPGKAWPTIDEVFNAATKKNLIDNNNTVLITANHFCRVYSGYPIADKRLIKQIFTIVKIKTTNR